MQRLFKKAKTLTPRTLIYDIDGVAANSQERFKRSGGVEALAKNDYNEFRKSMIAYAHDYYDDVPLEMGIQLLDQIRQANNVTRMVAVTARGEEGRESTLAWLKEHMPWDVFNEDLFMRPRYKEYAPGVYWQEGEPKFDPVEFKKQIALQLIRSNDVILAVDDHHDIVHGYWEIGVPGLCLMIPGVDQGTRMQSVISGVVQG